MSNLAWPKCTFFVYDRLSTADSIHITGTDFCDEGCSCNPNFAQVQIGNAYTVKKDWLFKQEWLPWLDGLL